MTREKIFIVDDDKNILAALKFNLLHENYNPIWTTRGKDALEKIKIEQPQLIILDLTLPDIDGFTICRLLKNDPLTFHIPIIMLTGRSEETDIVTGLELGADDYIVKPFSPRVLIARIRTILRKQKWDSSSAKTSNAHGIHIDPRRYEVRFKGKHLKLTATEFNLLKFLVRRPGWVFSRDQIIDGIRGVDYAVTDRSIDVHVMGLRKKLQGAGRYIETVRGIGYRFKD